MWNWWLDLEIQIEGVNFTFPADSGHQLALSTSFSVGSYELDVESDNWIPYQVLVEMHSDIMIAFIAN
jgi:hypothetical protein